MKKNIYSNPYLAGIGLGIVMLLAFTIIGTGLGASGAMMRTVVASGALSGRLKKETNKGPRITNKKRWAFAFIGGALFGIGSKLARGCTSSIALSGGATLDLGSWIIMLCIFAGAYMTAYFVRKLWI